MPDKKRDPYWDIVKGLGITAVVVGHSWFPYAIVLNYYHLAIFFFVAGFLYRDKYSVNPYGYIGKKLRELWWPNIKYVLAFILLHNTFLKLNIYSSVPGQPMIAPKTPYSILEIFQRCLNAILTTNYAEEMAGAMWFVLPLFVSMILFCLIRNSAIKLRLNETKKEVYTGVITLIFGAFGMFLFMNKITLTWRVDVSLLVMPIIYCGYVCKLFWDKINLKLFGAILSALVMFYFYKKGANISFAGSSLPDPFTFVFATASGIYLNLYIAKLLSYFQFSTKFVACLGKNSFHIMALQFLAFKAVNLIDIIYNQKPLLMLAQFPSSATTWWPLYTLAGLLLPIACVYVYKLIKSIFLLLLDKLFNIETKNNFLTYEKK